MPSKKLILRRIEKGLKVKIDRKTLKRINKIYEKNPVEYIRNIVIFSETLIVLAILDLYLLPHKWISRYPNTIVFAYDENLSIIKKFNELGSLLRRCLEYAAIPN
ncbi:hypothetical protein KEJ15_02835 [Candidatus Bathyarchaeota archaeon]|nr:hypothetical protein [Candidatus Bathyarchaeota archaeon]